MLPVEPIGMEITKVTINSTSGLAMTNSTTTLVFIEDDETFYLVYVYWGMAMLSFILMMLGHIKTKDGDAWI